MTDGTGMSAAAKPDLRRAALLARRSLSARDREDFSLEICRQVCATPQYRNARNLAAYIALADEVDTWSLIERAWRARKRVFVPLTEKNFSMQFVRLLPDTPLAMNRFGLLEPQSGDRIATRRLDLVLAPLVAFDETGNRIGMGGGYYDRAFSYLNGRRFFLRPKLIGLAFSCQQVQKIPVSPWDIPLFQIHTEVGPTLRATPTKP